MSDDTATAPDPAASKAPPTWPNRIARWTALVVFLAGFVLIVVPAGWHLKHVLEHPSPVTQTITTTVTHRGSHVTRVRRVESAPPSLATEALAGSGSLAWRFLLVLLAAFLAGALAQRACLANFAITLGPLKVPDIREALGASERSLATLEEAVDRQARAIAGVTEATASALQEIADRLEALEVVTGLDVDFEPDADDDQQEEEDDQQEEKDDQQEEEP